MKGDLITTKRELAQILKDIKDIKDTHQFTIGLEKQKGLLYWRIAGDE